MPAIIEYNLDQFVKFEFGAVTNKFAFQVNEVGATAGIDIPEESYVDTDANTIYVSDTTGLDANAGTKASPKKTLVASANACTITKTRVIVLDSFLYNEDMTSISNAFFEGFFADIGQTPKYTTRMLGYTPSNANTMFFAKFGTPGGTGTAIDPVNTIALAIALTDGTHQNIGCLDSGVYEEPGIEFTGNFKAMRSAIGGTPTFKPTISDSNFIEEQGDIKSQTDLTTTGVTTVASWTAVLSNGNAVVVFVDHDDSDKGKFFVINETGSEIVAETEFTDKLISSMSLVALDSGFAMGFSEDTLGTPLTYYAVYGSDGSVVKAKTQFVAGAFFMGDGTLLNNGDFVFPGADSTDSSKGKFIIYQADGTLRKALTEFEANATTALNFSSTTLDNDNFIIAYGDVTDGDGNFIGLSEDGTSVEIAKTQIVNASIDNISVDTLSNGDFAIGYQDNSDTFGYFIIRQEDGSARKAVTAFTAVNTFSIQLMSMDEHNSFIIVYANNGVTIGRECFLNNGDALGIVKTIQGGVTALDGSASIFNDNNIIVTYRDTADSSILKYSIHYPFSFSGIKMSADGIINGFILDANDVNQLSRIIDNDGFKIDSKWTDLINCTNLAVTDYSALDDLIETNVINGTGELYHHNNSCYDNSAGIKLTVSSAGDDIDIQDNEFYRNTNSYAIHIIDSESIVIEHNTIFNNYGSIRLENNGGSEIIKNNIFHSNDNGANLDVVVTMTNTVNTDVNTNLTAGSQVIFSNPLFINEGSVDPDDTDLNIKTRILGFPTDSPALLLGDDFRSAGCFFVVYIGSSTTFTAITVQKPNLAPMLVPVNPSFNKEKDGSSSSSRDAMSLDLSMNWNNPNIDTVDSLRQMWANADPEVRIYFQPVTSPNAFQLFKRRYDNYTEGITPYSQSDIGVAKVSFFFSRKYELEVSS